MRDRLAYYVSRLPGRLIPAFWAAARLGARKGEFFFFDTSLFGLKIVEGGIFGFCEGPIFQKLPDYEPHTIRALARLLDPSETAPILDVGANCGQMHLILKALCPSAPVHSFEALPEFALFLQELLRRNGWDADRAVHAAVSDEDGKPLVVHYGSAESLTASTKIVRPEHDRTVEVASLTLDAYAERNGLARPALVKIDIEGAEPEAVRGAARLLTRWKPPLLLEWLVPGPAEEGICARQREMESFLRGLGYRFHQIQIDGRLVEQDPVRPDKDYVLLNYLVLAG